MTETIQVEHLSKQFQEVKAVQDVSFSVRPGELFGFLGPNGAGKTTTINMLTGLTRPDGGSIIISGINCTGKPKAAQHLMGVVPDESNLYPELSGFENLAFCGALYGMSRQNREARAEELLEDFGLTEAGSRKFAGYSKGMKRRLTIAAGIIHSPKILFLDEPTSGIDVASARQIRRLIAELNRGGTTIFLTTHYIEEAERLCKRIAFIVSGRIVAVDTVESLMKGMEDRHVMRLEVNGDARSLCDKLGSHFSTVSCTPGGEGSIRLESPQPIKVGPILRTIEEEGSELLEARKILPSLEEVFVRITGIEANRMEMERAKGKGGKQV